jgi:hypothetical protein
VPLRDLIDLATLGAGLPRYLRHPVTIEQAREAVAARLARREELFLETADALVFADEHNPVRKLLRWAGCERGDLRQLVTRDGLDSALSTIRGQGVYFTSGELRGRVPVRRGTFELQVLPGEFDNRRSRRGLRGTTSGSSGTRLPVRYTWDFLAEEAENELLLLHSHGLADAPLALWMPGPPGIAGLHNLLLHARAGRPPERWFSQSRTAADSPGAMRVIDYGIRSVARFSSRFGPAPEWTPIERAIDVARWLEKSPRPTVLKGFASSASRLAAAALEAGIDLSGQVVFAGGEPLPARGREMLVRAGLRVFPRFVTTESGLLAGGCPEGADGSMHLYSDRVAVIAGNDDRPSALAVTALSVHSPKILFNAELGDQGVIRREACGCALGRSGLDQHVSAVSSPEKIAAAGVKLDLGDFSDLVERTLAEMGVSAEDFQLWIGGAEDGATRITIAIAPESRISTSDVLDRVRKRLPQLRAGALAASQWKDAGSLNVVLAPLRLSPGQKFARVLRDEGR